MIVQKQRLSLLPSPAGYGLGFKNHTVHKVCAAICIYLRGTVSTFLRQRNMYVTLPGSTDVVLRVSLCPH